MTTDFAFRVINFLPQFAVPLAAIAPDLERLSAQLVGEFLALERDGCIRHRSICLFGCDPAVMDILMRAMRAQLDRAGIVGIRVDSQVLAPLSSNGKYYIDVGYFLKAHQLLVSL